MCYPGRVKGLFFYVLQLVRARVISLTHITMRSALLPDAGSNGQTGRRRASFRHPYHCVADKGGRVSSVTLIPWLTCIMVNSRVLPR